jgi:hypothetical protein
MKLLIAQFSPASPYFIHRGQNKLSKTLFSGSQNSCYPQSFTLIKNSRKIPDFCRHNSVSVLKRLTGSKTTLNWVVAGNFKSLCFFLNYS